MVFLKQTIPPSNHLKVFFHKFYLVHFSILYLKCLVFLCWNITTFLNPFLAYVLILYPLKTTENQVSWWFQGVKNGNIGQKWVKQIALCKVGNSFDTNSFNPLNVNPTKWSSTLKQFLGKSRRIVWVCLTILWDWRLKG